MLSLRWLNGEVDLRPAPCSRSDLEQYVLSKLDSTRNKLVKLFRDDDEEKQSDHFHPDETVSVLILPETQLSEEETRVILQRFGEFWNPYSNMSFRDRMNSLSDPEMCLQFDKFRKILIKYGALVGSEAILSSFENISFTTFDVLVHHSKSEGMVQEMEDKLSMRVEEIVTRSALFTRDFCEFELDYDLARSKQILAYVQMTSNRCSVKVTVAIVQDDKPLEKVAAASELSFCDTWWDGHVIHAVDPEGIRRKEGVLKEEKLFCELNPSICDRLRKYRDRGYTIQIVLSTTTITLTSVTDEKEEHDRVWPLHYFLTEASEVLNVGQSIRFFTHAYPPVDTPSLEIIQEMWPEEVLSVVAKKILLDSDWVERKNAKLFVSTFRAYLFENPRQEHTFFTDWEWNGEMPVLFFENIQQRLREVKDRFLKSL